ncbi:MAG: hypothetical protein IIY49_09020 [Eubacterium sp.]|nr:hypothetical protein [Eubacterium sp.]
MKAIVEQYAKGEFRIDRPEVVISETFFKLNIEAGTVYNGHFTVSSANKYPIKGMVYDSRYTLRFEDHSFVSRSFDVKYSFDASCLEAGQNYKGHINVITDGGEFKLPYDINIVPPCVKYGDERIDDLFKFAALAEKRWGEAARLFVQDDFKRTFIEKESLIKQIYLSLLDSKSVDQALEEFLVLVHKKRTVTLSASKAKIELTMPEDTETIEIELSKNTWGYTYSDIRTDAEFIIPSKKFITSDDFVANECALKVLISPEHVPEGENTGKIIIENIYQKIEVEIHLTKPERPKADSEQRAKEREYKQCKIAITKAYLDFRMDKISLNKYVEDTINSFKTLNEFEPEEDLYRLGIIHMNILADETAKVEQEFLRIEADIDRNQMTAQEKCYYSYLKAMMARDKETVEKTANLLRRNFRTQEPKMFFFWLLLFVDPVYNEDKNVLYHELESLYDEGENSPIIYFELCDILNQNPMMLKELTPFVITGIKWGMRNKYISDDVLNEFVKLAGKNKEFNKQLFDVLRHIYDKNAEELKRVKQNQDQGNTPKKETLKYDMENSIKLKKDGTLKFGHSVRMNDEEDIQNLSSKVDEYKDAFGGAKEVSVESFSDIVENATESVDEEDEEDFFEWEGTDEEENDTDKVYKEDDDSSYAADKYDAEKISTKVGADSGKLEINPQGDPLRLKSEDFNYDREAEALEEEVEKSFEEASNDRFSETLRAEAAEKIIKKENENVSVLSSLCSMLISASKLDRKYHRFYRDAVQNSLKFIGLNECYIRSMDQSKYDLIPASVLMYLNYKNTLTQDELAYLYANVIYNKAEHMKIYHEYAPTMEDFMEKMIIEGKVNDDLTVLYDEFLDPESVSSMFAGKLINIIFRRKIVCFNPNVSAVIVTHEELQKVQRVPLKNGEAYVEILSDNASVIFEDKHGNRYAGSIPYHFERIVDEKAYIPICREYSPRDYRILLYNYESISEFTYKNAKEVNAAREIINCDEISYDFKQRACLNIIEYYHENLDTDVLVKYLRRLDIEYLTHANARTIITYLIDMNMFDKAFSAVKLYGFNELDVNELYRLADYGVRDSDGFLKEDLMSLCLNLYKTGTVNANILSYMISNFNGSVDELSSLFKLAKGKAADIGVLAENTLAQSMFANAELEYIYDIFATYYSGRSRGLVVKAFLRISANNYLIHDLQVPNYIFESLYQEILKGNIDDEVSEMALLLYFSRLGRFTDDQKKWIVDTVERFVDAGKVMPFFKKYVQFIRLPQDIFLKTYLIYRTDNVRQVFVDYSFDTGTRSKVKSRTARMEEIVRGFYIMEFVVFHGERLVYSIVDDPNGNAQIIESEVLKKKSYNKADLNRFEFINSMLVKQEMRDDTELLQNLDVYINTVHLFEENLTLL